MRGLLVGHHTTANMNRLERINLPGPQCVLNAAKRVLRSCQRFGDLNQIQRQTLSTFLGDLDVVKTLPGVNVEEVSPSETPEVKKCVHNMHGRT